MDLVKIVQSQGFGSRRISRQLIEAGEVLVNGEVCTDLKARPALDGLELTVQGVSVPFRAKAIVMMNKPTGYECSHEAKYNPSVYGLLPAFLVERDVQTIGRLDADTTGLLLFTDDGQLNHRLTSPKHHVPKCYRVTTAEAVTDEQIAQLLAGVVLVDDPEPAVATVCERVAENQILLTLTSGRYHQVKRMLAAVGNHVTALHRESVGLLQLGSELEPGEWCWVNESDIVAPRRA